MWLPDQCAEEIDTALKNKKFRHIDRLLENVFQNGQAVKDAARICPVCKKDLVYRALPYLELVLNACADGHGSWLHPKACTELWAVIADHIATRARKRKILLTMLSLCSLLLAFDILTGTRALQHKAESAGRTIQDEKIGLEYWPMRDTSRYALPLKESSIDDIEELYYVKLLTDHLDIILSNRINMAAVLDTRRKPQEYSEIFSFFYEKQSIAAAGLRKIEPPARLKAVHEKIHEAVVMQIGFYSDYVEEKIQVPETSLQDMLRHEALIKSNTKLREAWKELQTLFPDMDEKTRLAVESRLCWSDVI